MPHRRQSDFSASLFRRFRPQFEVHSLHQTRLAPGAPQLSELTVGLRIPSPDRLNAGLYYAGKNATFATSISGNDRRDTDARVELPAGWYGRVFEQAMARLYGPLNGSGDRLAMEVRSSSGRFG